MRKRLTATELAAHLDGLAIAFFASMSALITALIEIHPDGIGLIETMRDEALGMVAGLDEADQDMFSPAAIRAAVFGVTAAFVSRAGEDGPSNDNG